jgi:HPt (histidine-containing phosphotransfer) domain-containing protein
MTDPSAASDTPVFDKAGLLSRLMDDADLVRAVIEVFLADMPRQFESLAAAVASQDRETAERIAHSVKGAASNVGGEHFREVASLLEDLAHDGDLDAVSGHLAELRTQFSRLREAMAGEV